MSVATARVAKSPDTEGWVSGLIVALAKSIDARRVLEVGCWKGMTTEKLLDALPSDGEYYGLDLSPHPDMPFEVAHDPRLHLIYGDSRQTIEQVPDGLDLAFVDGSHEYPTVLCDYGAAWKRLRVGGILCGHDILAQAWPDVKRAADLVLPKYIAIETAPWPGVGLTGLLIATKERD